MRIFFRLLKAIAQGGVLAFALSPLPASAAMIFQLDFGCTSSFNGDPCTDGTDAGGGTITFPELGPANPAAPYPGVTLDLTFLTPVSLSFTEADITSIAWTISPDMSTLVALALTLDTDPSCTTDGQNPPPCEHQLASVTIDLGEGTWDALREGCDSEGRCFRTVPYRERTATASPALVPEPAAVWLFGTGMLGLIGFARRRKVA